MNEFVSYMNDYRQKCDMAFDDGSIKVFLSSLDSCSKMSGYIDALIRHSAGGKRIRACLVALGYFLFSHDDVETVLFPSLSYELFQTGILAHDDIIDNSDYRRFKPSMHKDLGKGHDGVSKSICVGDLGIISAVEILTKCGFSDEIKLRAISHQNRVFCDTIAGELKDIEFSYAERVEECDILDMYKLKTAQYTVSGPLVLGAILAGASEDAIAKLSLFGDSVGISFQIRDDILGIYGDEKQVGKSILSDMCEGKKTVLVSHFDRTADEKAKEEFYAVYGKADSTLCDLEKVRKLLIDNGSLSYAEGLCKEYVDRAEVLIGELAGDENKAELLSGLLLYMTSRKN